MDFGQGPGARRDTEGHGGARRDKDGICCDCIVPFEKNHLIRAF